MYPICILKVILDYCCFNFKNLSHFYYYSTSNILIQILLLNFRIVKFYLKEIKITV